MVIYQKFFNLEKEKQERIINAALKEFTKNGYEKASTNEIIKEAEISKGSLFQYFNNKKELYLFLLDYVVEIINKIYDEINFNETDYFNRTKEIGFIKFEIMKRFPQAFDFLKTIANEDSRDVKSEIQKIRKLAIEEGFGKGYQNIDWTKFRDDMDINKMKDIISWTFLSFSQQQISKINSFEVMDREVLKEWDEYFDILKRCFYKKEEK
ncbi:TetR family transcriptional regulator [Mobilisporobacter senegalensis]|uniref:TetR family transcriptional regulator n=1 Tax=Mobilisporobacter senegalensis TaxID=1329262 RepID=A0A3N1XB40_9FIRM|nr:TetR/AcrR family transcriptional regulator [Mobilisporobacter senegalensis]ROR23963.1 TetR family transcriptional regulator [Mobilisporobacter senegalensis]